jgi:hypothetical protein
MEMKFVTNEKEGDKMSKDSILNKEIFLSVAKAYGLDTEDPHIEELYVYAKDVLPGLKAMEDLDLNDIEPIMTFIPLGE